MLYETTTLLLALLALALWATVVLLTPTGDPVAIVGWAVSAALTLHAGRLRRDALAHNRRPLRRG